MKSSKDMPAGVGHLQEPARTINFMKKIIKTKSQKLNTDEKITPYMEKWIGKIEKDIKAGKNMSGPFHSVEELRKHLEK